MTPGLVLIYGGMADLVSSVAGAGRLIAVAVSEPPPR